MQSYKDKTVLITGGAGGIGLCLAHEFARAGARIILTDLNETALDKAAEEIAVTGAPVFVRAVDVGVLAQVQALADWIETEHGGLQVLVNNAGIGHNGELADTSMRTWKRLMRVNFWGALHHIQAFLPGMIERGQGQIVNVSSGQAFFQMPTWGAYTTSKVALSVLSDILHYELRPHNIHVTTVYPFMVDTGFYDQVAPETWGGRMSMRLLPYYSMSPETTARIIFKATKKRRRIEKVSLLNQFGYYARILPVVGSAISRMANLLLARGDAPRITRHPAAQKPAMPHAA